MTTTYETPTGTGLVDTPGTVTPGTVTVGTATVDAGQPGTAGQEQHLVTGWEAQVPTQDTFLRRFLVACARMCEALAAPAGGRTVWTPDFAASDHGRPASFYTSATLLRPPTPETFEATLETVERFYAVHDLVGEIFLWSAWPTPDLRPRGWHLIGHPPLLIRPPAAVAAIPPSRPRRPAPGPVGDTPASGVGRHPEAGSSADARLVDVRDAAGLAAWERVAVEGYPLSELSPAEPGKLIDPGVLDNPRLHFSLGYDGDQPVSAGALYTDLGEPASGSVAGTETGSGSGTGPASLGAGIRDIGVFSLGVTLPAARNRGHWRAHATHRLLLAPELWMAAAFSDDSRPGAERLGFVPITRLTLWARNRRQGHSAPLT